MCELFALNASREVDIRDYLEIFFSHCDRHPNGWGLSYNVDDEIFFYKQAVKATKSMLLKDIMSGRILTKNLLAHIRLATIGDMNPSNCHPFEAVDNNDRRWTLIHNGTIFDYPQLDRYKDIQAGCTDSERILHYIVDCINSKEIHERLNDKKLCELIDDIICELSKNNKLNLILFNEEILFMHKNCARSLYILDKEDYMIISTLALTGEDWVEADINTLYAVKDSNIIYKGKRHENEYIISEDDVEFILNSLSDDALDNLLNAYGSIENIKRQLYDSHK